MAPATMTRGTTAVDDDLEDAVAEFSDDEDGDDTETDEGEANGTVTALKRGRVKFDGNITNHERKLRQAMALKLKAYDEKHAEARATYIAGLEEKLQVQIGQVALRVDPKSVTNPDAIRAALAKQLERQEASIRALQAQLASLTPAETE